MTDKPVLKTPGELLVEARQAAGLELDLVSERTKIPVAILRSLELDEYHKISGPLYVNSFLRTYAVDLGLDTGRVMEAYKKFSGDVVATGSVPDSETVWEEEEVRISRVGVPWGVVGPAIGAVVVLVVLVLWLTSQRGCSAGDSGFEAGADSSPLPESLLAEPQSSGSALSDNSDPGESLQDLSGASDASLAADLPGREGPSTIAEQTELPVPTLPDAVAGDAGITFQDGRRWPVVLRLLCAEPVRAKVVRDGERGFREVGWLDPGESYPVLTSEGLKHGFPYRTRQGLAVYWGARDQFSLKLDRIEGVEISLNGRVRNIDDLQPGQEIILFVPQNLRNSGS